MSDDADAYRMQKPWSVLWRLERMAYGAEPVYLQGEELPDLTGANLLMQMEHAELYRRLGVGMNGKPLPAHPNEGMLTHAGST